MIRRGKLDIDLGINLGLDESKVNSVDEFLNSLEKLTNMLNNSSNKNNDFLSGVGNKLKELKEDIKFIKDEIKELNKANVTEKIKSGNNKDEFENRTRNARQEFLDIKIQLKNIREDLTKMITSNSEETKSWKDKNTEIERYIDNLNKVKNFKFDNKAKNYHNDLPHNGNNVNGVKVSNNNSNGSTGQNKAQNISQKSNTKQRNINNIKVEDILRENGFSKDNFKTMISEAFKLDKNSVKYFQEINIDSLVKSNVRDFVKYMNNNFKDVVKNSTKSGQKFNLQYDELNKLNLVQKNLLEQVIGKDKALNKYYENQRSICYVQRLLF